MPGHWHNGPAYFDDVLRRFVGRGEWVPYGEEGAGISSPPVSTPYVQPNKAPKPTEPKQLVASTPKRSARKGGK